MVGLCLSIIASSACGSSEDDYVEALTGERPRQVRDMRPPPPSIEQGERDAEVPACPDEAPECDGGCELTCVESRWMCAPPVDPPPDPCGGGDDDCDGVEDENAIGQCCDGMLEPPCNGAHVDTDVPHGWVYVSAPGTTPLFVMQYEVTAKFWNDRVGDRIAAPGAAGTDRPVTTVDVFVAMAFANAASLDAARPTCYRDDAGRSLDFDLLDDARRGAARFTLVDGCRGLRLPRLDEVRALALTGWAAPEGDCPVLEGACPGEWCYRAWCECNETNIQPVGTRQGSGLGIFDLVGNVTEWGWPDEQDASPLSDDPWPLYGGAVGGVGHGCGLDEPAIRIYDAEEASPGEPANLRFVGFRLVQSVAVDGR